MESTVTTSLGSAHQLRLSLICSRQEASARVNTKKTHRIVTLKLTASTRRLVRMTMFENTSKSSSSLLRNLELTYSPLVSYDSVTSNLDRLAKIKNFTMFNNDLNNKKLPQ
jgi:hypothetical protein